MFSAAWPSATKIFPAISKFRSTLNEAGSGNADVSPVYALSLLAFSGISVLGLFLLQRFQGSLFLNPTDMVGVPPALAFNTAASFVTNTNWQNYGGESTMSHLTQMSGLAVQNFVSAAVGIAVAVALIRGFTSRRSETIGNFWVDVTRVTTRVLLPLAVVIALVLVSQGVVQNLAGFTEATTVEGAQQSIPGGPIASQEAIKELGTNGGGPYNANSAHPFENPNGFSNLIEMWALLAIPFALTYAFGRLVSDQRQGWALFAAMFVLWIASAGLAMGFEIAGNPEVEALGTTDAGNYEGKEVRFGAPASGLFAASTTGTSTGAVIAAHDSFTPLGGAVPLVNMMLGEVSPGGVGAGLYGMLIFALLAVFIAGLMVGRTPEYLGKKIQATEMKLVVLYLLIVPTLILVFASLSVVLDEPEVVDPEPRPARPLRGRLRVHLGGEQQRLGVRRPDREHRLVQHDARPGDARRPLPPHRARPRYRGSAGAQAARSRHGRDVPDRDAALRRPARRRDPDHGRAHVLPRPRPRADPRAAGVVVARQPRSLLDPAILRRAAGESVLKLDPRRMARNPVMFVVELGSVLVTFLWLKNLSDSSTQENVFAGLVAAWLWFTVLFANFAEAVAEGRGKAQADELRKTRAATIAHRRLASGALEDVPSAALRLGDEVVVSAGEVIPADGEVIEGIASVDESAITGESAPVIRESGGDRSAVTGGTRVLSDQIVVRVTAVPGESFLDRMIKLVEGAERQKTPNEVALNILITGLTIVFLLSVVTLQPFAIYSSAEQNVIVLVALLVCLIPTTIGGLLSAIGIAGMDRLVRRNVLALSGRAVEAAGDCSTLLLDKTGTITLGNRQATELIPLPGVTELELADAAQLASLADETPEGRSIVVLAKEQHGLREREIGEGMLVPFTAQTRMSGIDLDGRRIRKGAADSIRDWIESVDGTVPAELGEIVDGIAASGGTPLVVADNGRALGVVHLKDVVKEGLRERFAELRSMGIRTVMITGDNPLTAKAIADEAGVDDFLAEAKPEDKMALIRREQEGGNLVAMTGDGTNDAPALAQADVGVAMNTGTQAAREAGNMVDLDSNPTKLIEIVEIGKQLLITRGSLTTFSVANDVAKYFAIIPAMFAGSLPELERLNVMELESPRSAILSAVIFNALIIVALIPLALRGVRFRARSAAAVLRRNLLVYGLGGIVVPFIGIKLIDVVVSGLGMS